MERKLNALVVIFFAIALISLAGFFNSYLRFFPVGKNFSAVIHTHFIAFILWFCLLIVQPVLIRKRKFALHRKLGKSSYFLTPVLVISIVLLVVGKVEREMLSSVNEASVTSLIGLLVVVSFSAFYLISMANRKNVRWHVAFIIAASLIILNPGMSRILNTIKPGLGILGAILVPFLVSVTLILFEKLKYKRPVLKSPYFLFFLLWMLEISILVIIPGTAWWPHLINNLF